MRLYLVQHGEPDRSDPEKPLSDKGLSDVRAAAGFLSRARLWPDIILHSGKLRSAQTASEISGVIGLEAEKAEGLLPLDDPSILAGKLSEGSRDILVAGHLPQLSKLASLLLSGDDGKDLIAFTQAGVTCLQRGPEGKWSVLFSLPQGMMDIE